MAEMCCCASLSNIPILFARTSHREGNGYGDFVPEPAAHDALEVLLGRYPDALQTGAQRHGLLLSRINAEVRNPFSDFAHVPRSTPPFSSFFLLPDRAQHGPLWWSTGSRFRNSVTRACRPPAFRLQRASNRRSPLSWRGTTSATTCKPPPTPCPWCVGQHGGQGPSWVGSMDDRDGTLSV